MSNKPKRTALEKEQDAWRKLQRGLSTPKDGYRESRQQRRIQSLVKQYWQTICQIHGINDPDTIASYLGKDPVNPYKECPVSGEPRDFETPEEQGERELRELMKKAGTPIVGPLSRPRSYPLE